MTVESKRDSARRSLSGRRGHALPLLLACLLAAGCGSDAATIATLADRSLARAARYLIGRQSADGAWRSDVYGVLREDLALTPPTLKVLVLGPAAPGIDAARRRAADRLCDCAGDDGSIDPGPHGLSYPVYTAATAVMVLTHFPGERERKAREAWLRLLRSHQLAEDLGWEPSDPAFGGWGYSVVPPRKPAPGERAKGSYDSDLSSTVFALGALRIGGAKEDDPAVRKGLVFVTRCQNLPADDETAEPAFDDGGFHFTPTNEVQNKAGLAGTDRQGRERFRSYGSATADGLRALLRCGIPATSRRVVAARRWLESRFSAEHNPGEFEPLREVERDAAYYYWCWSVAHAFRALDVREIETARGRVLWADRLARELLRRQREDGCWAGPLTAVKEDDPLVATPLACGALALCRLALEP